MSRCSKILNRFELFEESSFGLPNDGTDLVLINDKIAVDMASKIAKKASKITFKYVRIDSGRLYYEALDHQVELNFEGTRKITVTPNDTVKYRVVSGHIGKQEMENITTLFKKTVKFKIDDGLFANKKNNNLFTWDKGHNKIEKIPVWVAVIRMITGGIDNADADYLVNQDDIIKHAREYKKEATKKLNQADTIVNKEGDGDLFHLSDNAYTRHSKLNDAAMELITRFYSELEKLGFIWSDADSDGTPDSTEFAKHKNNMEMLVGKFTSKLDFYFYWN